MSRAAYIAPLTALASAVLLSGMGMAAPIARASFGPEVFEAGTCETKACTYKKIEEGSGEQFTQAAGHPPWGGTKFIMKHSGSSIEGASVKRLRVDVPAGLAANPQAPMPKCSIEKFDKDPEGCPKGSEVGTTELEAAAEPLGLLAITLPKLEGKVYNLEAPAGLPLDFGIAVEPAGELITPIHLFLEGHLSWAKEPSLEARGAPSGDYHEYFEINDVPDKAEVKALIGVESPLKVLMSKLNFNGHAGGDFLTLPSVCSNTTTSYLELESWPNEQGQTEIADAVTHTPVGVEGCDRVPFAPTSEVGPELAASGSDQPDGATTVVDVKQNTGAEEINTADIQNAHVTLPQGLTLNPSAAQGLEACSAAHFEIGATTPTSCPAGSKIGTVSIETDLPPGSLTGNVYLASPSGAMIENPPYTIYLEANATGVDPKTGLEGVSVRLQGTVNPNPVTGRLEVSFENNPQLPFSELRLTLNGGERAPLANPLACGNAPTESLFTAYSGEGVFKSFAYATPFEITGCANPLPFSLSQTTTTSNPNAGGYTNFTFNLTRSDGQQYLSQIQTTLPPGLVGLIPSVALCGETQANEGTCPSTSEIGAASVTAGAGEPYPFMGRVYLTGPYNGAPYGLSIVVPAIAGPFNLGDVVTRAQIAVNPHTGRVIVTSGLPSIARGVGRLSSGVPLRLRTIGVTVNRPNFMLNPTNCSALSDASTLTSTFGSTQSLSSPFQVNNCGALAFKPSFKAATSAHTSKLNGASLQVSIVQPAHEANIASVFAALPKQLPSRLTTLQKACPEATFAANPRDCRPLGSEVGTASVATPVLPGPPPGRDANLTGSAYLVSHGGEAFPDLDLVLEGDGVTVILTGATDIKDGITSSTFASVPDVPISSFTLSLPVGPHSALTAVGNLCAVKLFMPTTITAQSGAQVKQDTRISVGGCGVRILSHRVRGHRLLLRLRTLVAGRVTIRGRDLRSLSRSFAKAKTFTVEVPLSRAGLQALRSHRQVRVGVHVTFTPRQHGLGGSSASTTAKFRR